MTTDRTLLRQSGTFSGALVPFKGSLLTRTRSGSTAMNEALATDAEGPGSGPIDERTRHPG
jgi:hypothetical protein